MSAPTISFGTDGWRAVIADDFTYETVRAVAQGVAWYLGKDESRPIVVAHDARFSAELFSREVCRVLAANRCSVLLLNRVVPTPTASWTVVDRKAAGAVVVTASHNPAEFNGLKYKPDFGGSAPPEVVAEIEKHSNRALSEGVTAISWPEAQATGRITEIDPMPSYMAQLGRMVDLPKLRSAGISVLHEAMYGAGQGIIREALAGGTTRVDEIHSERNPGFGGMHPEPIGRYMPEAMAIMAKGGHDLAIANDGDADRVGVIDETGRFINQLEVAALFAMYLLEKRGERGDLVRSLTSTLMLDRLGEHFSVPVHETPVGFKHIGGVMQKTNALLGAEESGGFAFRGHIPERDGILAGLLMAEMVVAYERPLSQVVAHLRELVGEWSYDRHDIRFEREGYPERKARVYQQMETKQPTEIGGSRIVKTRSDDGFKFTLEDGAWVLMRMSGTEPLMRVYSEAQSPERVAELISALEVTVGVEAPSPAAAGAH